MYIISNFFKVDIYIIFRISEAKSGMINACYHFNDNKYSIVLIKNTNNNEKNNYKILALETEKGLQTIFDNKNDFIKTIWNVAQTQKTVKMENGLDDVDASVDELYNSEIIVEQYVLDDLLSDRVYPPISTIVKDSVDVLQGGFAQQ